MIIKIFATIAYLGMVVVNGLANALPINNMNTGEVAALYPNLFTPTALTFSIWGLIYGLLAIYLVYYLGLFREKESSLNESLLKKIGVYFIITSVANVLWIYSWHYTMVSLSLFFMIVILFFLSKIADLFKGKSLSLRENIFVRLPFSVYFGWITVATIANVTVLLVSRGWSGLGLSEPFWMVLILFVGAFIGILRMMEDRSIAYGLVFVWAYSGIIIRHTSPSGFAGEYVYVIGTAAICIILFLIFEALLLTKHEKKQVLS